MRPRPCTVLFVACALAVPSVAQDSDEDVATLDADQAAPAVEEACFRTRDIRDFDPLTDELMLIEGRRDDYYLLTMLPGCFGLESAIGITIRSRTSQVCSNSADEVRYRGVAGRRESCPILKVEAVESKEDAERLAELRSD